MGHTAWDTSHAKGDRRGFGCRWKSLPESVCQRAHPSGVLLSHVQSRGQAAQSLRVLVLHAAERRGAGDTDTEILAKMRIFKRNKKKKKLRRAKRKGNNPREVKGKVMEIEQERKGEKKGWRVEKKTPDATHVYFSTLHISDLKKFKLGSHWR